ncbi:MAG: T9SS type A sorting domain-containing protein, partial [Bacteroidota bacterium]
NGSLTVWPPVLCKTTNTNWEGGTSTGIHELQNVGISVYPNPVNGQALTVVSPGQTSFKLADLMGNLIYSGAFSDASTIDASFLSTGIYFLDLKVNGKRYLQKILKTD